MGIVWLIFQIKHLEGKDKPVGLRFDASNLETTPEIPYVGTFIKRWYKVSGSALQNEHRSSVLKPILRNFEVVYKIELSTLN